MLYTYRCVNCGAETVSTHRGDKLIRVCVRCGQRDHQRVWGVSFHRPMQQHFNKATGTVVSSMRGFKNDLARKSEEYTALTGIEANFQPIDNDPATLGVTEEGLTGRAAEWASRGDNRGAGYVDDGLTVTPRDLAAAREVLNAMERDGAS